MVTGKVLLALQPDWVRVDAANGEEALTRIAAGGVDVVLFDYNMPGKNGLVLTEELPGLHPTMPIALITANLQDEIVARARALNAAFVAKPVTEDGLRGFISGVALRLRAHAT